MHIVTTGVHQPDFLAALLDALHGIELAHGRERPYRNAPRTLDLDILLYGDQTIDLPSLHVPHPRMQERAFVLVPLLEVADGRYLAESNAILWYVCGGTSLAPESRVGLQGTATITPVRPPKTKMNRKPSRNNVPMRGTASNSPRLPIHSGRQGPDTTCFTSRTNSATSSAKGTASLRSRARPAP